MAASMIVRDGANVARTITAMVVRDGTNTARTISEGWIRDANNVSRLFFNPSGSLSFEVTATPTSVSGVSSGTGTATTDETIATATGGTAPYTYAWTAIAGDGPVVPTATAPADDTTAFIQTSMAPNTAYTATFRCTATDANSVTAFTDVTANFADVS